MKKWIAFWLSGSPNKLRYNTKRWQTGGNETKTLPPWSDARSLVLGSKLRKITAEMLKLRQLSVIHKIFLNDWLMAKQTIWNLPPLNNKCVTAFAVITRLHNCWKAKQTRATSDNDGTRTRVNECAHLDRPHAEAAIHSSIHSAITSRSNSL